MRGDGTCFHTGKILQYLTHHGTEVVILRQVKRSYRLFYVAPILPDGKLGRTLGPIGATSDQLNDAPVWKGRHQ
jgi:hypothetical protein